MKPILPILVFLAGAIAIPSASTASQTCQLQSQKTYNDTFDQLIEDFSGENAAIIPGNGTMYIGGAVINQAASAEVLPAPSPNYVLANYRTLNGILTMVPYEGTMNLFDLRYACSAASGGFINPTAPQGCTITVNCTSTNAPPVAKSLDFATTNILSLETQFSYAEFDDSFDNLTSCTFIVDAGQSVEGNTVAMLFDNIGYLISTFASS